MRAGLAGGGAVCPWSPLLLGLGWVLLGGGGAPGQKERGSRQAVGLRRAPGVGAALNSLPQLPGCPQLPKAQIRGAGSREGGGARMLGRSIHTAALA